MRRLVAACVLLAGCWGDHAYIVEGTVVDVNSSTEIVVDHKAIPGLMDAMIMPFRAHDAQVFDGVHKGDRIVARLMVEDGGMFMERVRVTGQGAPPAVVDAGAPLHAGDTLDRVEVPVTGGGTWTLGAGQGAPTALGFVFTTCPNPEFCPATITRMQGLQQAAPAGSRIMLVTIDPKGDTAPVLQAYADKVGAKPEVWRFGRVEADALQALAARAALTIDASSGAIVHATRLLVLDGQGKLIERYDDNRWPLDRVVSQLATGAPTAPPGSDGTMTPAPDAAAPATAP